MTIDPAKFYEVRGVVTPILCAGLGVAVGNDQTVIAAVSGKKIRVMGWIAQGVAGIPTYVFKNGSGGSQLAGGLYAPNGATAGDSTLIPIVDSGYFETSTGVGLFADVAVVTVNMSVFYIAYTP